MVKASGDVFKQKDGRWIARYYVGDKRKTVYGLTEQEATIKRQEIIDELNNASLIEIRTAGENKEAADIGNGELTLDLNISNCSSVYAVDAVPTLGEWLVEWLETQIKPHKSVNTYKGYRIIVQKHIIPAMASIKLSDLTPEIIQVFFNTKMIEVRNGTKDGGMSPQSLRNIHFMMKSALSVAEKEKLISYNPMDLVNAIRVARKDKKFLTIAEGVKLIEACCASDKIIMYGVIIALRLGLNVGELLALKWADIDFNQKLVCIRHILRRVDEEGSSKKKTALQLHETNSTRIIHEHELLDWPQMLEGEFADPNRCNNNFFTDIEMLQARYKVSLGFVPLTIIANTTGSLVDPGYYLRLFKAILDTADIESANFDILRNTYAIRLFEKGYDSNDVHRILGYSEASRPIEMLRNIALELNAEHEMCAIEQ